MPSDLQVFYCAWHFVCTGNIQTHNDAINHNTVASSLN